MKTLTLISILALAASVTGAQWVQTSAQIPGGAVSAVLVSHDTLIVALSTHSYGEANGVYGSTDMGGAWRSIGRSLGSETNPVMCLANCGSYLLVGTWYSGVFRSSDWGKTWGRRMNDRIIYSIAVDGSTVYAGTNGSGVIVSTNQGATWNISGPDNTWVDHGIAVTDRYVFALQTSSYPFLIRADKATSGWTPINSPADSLYSAQIYAKGSAVFILTSKGLFTSRDHGVSWSGIHVGLPEGQAVKFLRSLGDSIVAVAGAGIYSSTDLGDSWHFLSSMPSVECTTFEVNSRLWAIGAGGLLISKDLGKTWCRRSIAGLATHLAASGTNLFAGTSLGISLSTDNGTGWAQAGLSDIITCLAAYSDSSGKTNLLAGTYYPPLEVMFGPPEHGGVLLSTDLGMNWSHVDSKMTGPSSKGYGAFPPIIKSLAVVPNGTGTTWFYAGTKDYGIFRTTNIGGEWTELNSGLSYYWYRYVTVNAFAVIDTLIFAGTAGGVFRSVNGGTNWIPVNTGLTDTVVSALAVQETNLFAGTPQGVFLSTNKGTSWIAVDSGLAGTSILSFAVSGPNLFAGTLDGVFLSTNWGSSWKPINSGLTDVSVGDFAVGETHLFAGTVGGIWRRPLSEMITSVDPVANELPRGFLLHQNYPNPFNPTTAVSYQLPVASNVRLLVYDLLGREVATLVDENKPAGVYKVQFDASGLASGVYLYRMTAGTFVETKKLVVLR